MVDVSEGLELPDVFGQQIDLYDTTSDFKYKCTFLGRWHSLDEEDRLLWVIDKTRINKPEIRAAAYSVHAMRTIIDNDIRDIFHENPETYDYISPMVEGTIAYLHGKISENGEVRNELRDEIKVPEQGAPEMEEPKKETLKERVLGRFA